ncbi:MAG: serine hydrolase domain-containing protein [Gemmataceae bacterium]
MRIRAWCVVLALAPAAFADGPASPVRSRMQAFIDSGDIAGAVTVVGRVDGVLALDTVGLADIDGRKAMTPETMFRIASMTKPIVSIAIMQLAEAGKLNVSDPVEKHLPEFKGQMLAVVGPDKAVTLKKPSRPIHIRDLLTHTSGLPNPQYGLADIYRTRRYTLAEGVMAFSQRPLDFEPGSKWSYCNSGIDTLGRIVEVASGMAYDDYLKKNIFDPLGMKNTATFPTPAQLERTATIYEKKDGKLVATNAGFLGPPPGAKYPVPAGGLYSCAVDLAKLYRAMLGKGALGDARILKPETVAEMTTLHTGDIPAGFPPGPNVGWGYGWCVLRKPEGITATLSAGTFGHGGAYGTQVWCDPTKGTFQVLLIQRTGINADASPMRQAMHEGAAGLLAK